MNKPQVIVSSFNTEPREGNTMYIDIDILRFVKDKEINSVVVQVLECEEYVYLDEIENKGSVLEFVQLLVLAQEWIINHVRIN